MDSNFTQQQNDYAVFLPAISSFYATFVGRQRYETYVDPARIPSHFTNGLESGNWLSNDGLFNYKWSLYSSGHVDLDTTKHLPKEAMIRERDRSTSFIVGDSGGYQIGKGVWEADWKDPNCPKAHAKRDAVLKWMDAYMDYGMTLDVPSWLQRSSQEARDRTGIHSYEDACSATEINNEYWIRNRKGECRFLNTLQGENHTEADDWYNRMKKYCDPKQYENHFNGWAMGGQNVSDVHLILKRIVTLMRDGLLEKGLHDWMHVLGTSKLEWACLLTDVQRAIRKNYNENFTISYDCASPFLAVANGQVYCELTMEDRKRWSYRMMKCFDDRNLHTDTTPFAQAFIREGCYHKFDETIISKGLTAADICAYGPGDLNKIGKEGSTSWDSFTYFLLMAHSVALHIHACQESNRRYDKGIVPSMLVQEDFDRVLMRDVINEIIGCADSDKALELVDEYSRLWMEAVGTRGYTGKRAINSNTKYYDLFQEV